MLPGIDGFEVLRRLRATKIDTRVLILTARGEVSDRVTGLGLGADDYLAKPFAMQELVARVSALGRRFPEKAPIKLQIGDLVLNLIDRKLYRGPRRIELSARELTLLRVLMREPGRIFSRTELCERVWEREHEYGVKLVEAYISRLRKKINSPPLIHTVRHLGYTIREPNEKLAITVEGRALLSVAGRGRDARRRDHHLVCHAPCRDRGFRSPPNDRRPGILSGRRTFRR